MSITMSNNSAIAIFYFNRAPDANTAPDSDYDLVRICKDTKNKYLVEFTECAQKKTSVSKEITLDYKADLQTYVVSTLCLLQLDGCPFYSIDVMIAATPSIKIKIDNLKSATSHILTLLTLVA